MSELPFDQYTIYYPHPDGPCLGDIEFPGDQIDMTLLFLLRQAQKEYPAMESISKRNCTLFRPSGLRLNPQNTLFERTRQWLKEHLSDQDVQVQLYGSSISEVLPVGRDRHDLDILFVTPDIEESLDEVGEYDAAHGKAIRSREAGAIIAKQKLLSLSAGVESFTNLKNLFKRDGYLFHAGRPHDNYGPPVALFNPTLGLLAYRLSHLDDDLPEIRPNHHESKQTHEFIVQSLDSYDNEDLRRAAVQSFIFSLDPDVELKRQMNKIVPDVVFGAKTGFPYGIEEDKNEAGLQGDASTQARLAYAHIVVADTGETKRIRQRSNCPAVVIGLMGDLVEIGIAVYTDGAYSDHVFTTGRMRLDFHQNANVLRIARAFKAVKLAFADLRRFYERLKVHPPPYMSVRHLFPSPVPEPTWQGDMPHVTFTHRMSRTGEVFITATTEDERRSGMYLGTMRKATSSASSLDATEECVEVVVKFTAMYSEEAHRILADAGFAPTLHACVPVCGGVKMVVMDRVQGEMAWDAENRSENLPHTVYEDVRKAIDVLHGAGLVFGDLRLNNIMCVPGATCAGDPGAEPRLGAMLVDFDWAGKADESRYPVVLNDGLGIWAKGADRCAIMQKVHDLYLLEDVRALCRSQAVSE